MPGVMNKLITRAMPQKRMGKMTKLSGMKSGKARGISTTSTISIKSKLSKKGKETK